MRLRLTAFKTQRSCFKMFSLNILLIAGTFVFFGTIPVFDNLYLTAHDCTFEFIENFHDSILFSLSFMVPLNGSNLNI